MTSTMPTSTIVAGRYGATQATNSTTRRATPIGPMATRPVQRRPNLAFQAAGSPGMVGRDNTNGDSLLVALNALPLNDSARAAVRASAIEWYLPLALHLARRYAGRGEPLGDLVQVATIGLIKAIDRYDPGRNVPFASYATPTILGEIKRYFRDITWTIRVPRRLQEARSALNTATEQMTRQLQRTPRTTEIGAALGVSTATVDAARQVGSAYRPLSQPRLSADGEMISPLDLVGAPDAGFEAVDRRLSLQPLLAALPERDRRILALRFIDELTQSEIAVKMGLSQMHVSRLLARSLSALHEQMLAESA
jgi:RNA polymerase sigma-B factor